MRRPILILFLGSLVLVALAIRPAQAVLDWSYGQRTAIAEYGADDYSISTDAKGQPDGTTEPLTLNTGVSDWNLSADAYVNLSTTHALSGGVHTFTGSSDASLDADYSNILVAHNSVYAYGGAVIDLEFTTNQSYQYHLVGTLTPDNDIYAFSTHELVLDNVVNEDVTNSHAPLPFDVTGTLPAGDHYFYTLFEYVVINTQDYYRAASASTSYTLTLTPVPEPASLSLFALIAVAQLRRFRR